MPKRDRKEKQSVGQQAIEEIHLDLMVDEIQTDTYPSNHDGRISKVEELIHSWNDYGPK